MMIPHTSEPTTFMPPTLLWLEAPCPTLSRPHCAERCRFRRMGDVGAPGGTNDGSVACSKTVSAES